MTEPDRRLTIPGLGNIRDVGRYPTQDGRQTAWGVLVRSDSPHDLSQAAINELLGYGIRMVIDLRGNRELERRPNPMASLAETRYHHVPLSEEAPLPTAVRGTLDGMFRHYLDNCQSPIAQVFTHLASSDNGTLVHCNGGMHRTGIVTALYLSLAGVPKAVIAQDFALSATYLGDRLETARARRIADGWTPEDAAWFTDTRPEVMVSTLDYLDERYGGAAKYLSDLGINGEALSRLRNAMSSEQR